MDRIGTEAAAKAGMRAMSLEDDQRALFGTASLVARELFPMLDAAQLAASLTDYARGWTVDDDYQDPYRHMPPVLTFVLTDDYGSYAAWPRNQRDGALSALTEKSFFLEQERLEGYEVKYDADHGLLVAVVWACCDGVAGVNLDAEHAPDVLADRCLRGEVPVNVRVHLMNMCRLMLSTWRDHNLLLVLSLLATVGLATEQSDWKTIAMSFLRDLEEIGQDRQKFIRTGLRFLSAKRHFDALCVSPTGPLAHPDEMETIRAELLQLLETAAKE